MIKLQGKLDREIYVACSGGVDSMAVLNFLSRNHKVTAVFFHHGTETSEKAFQFLFGLNIPLQVGYISRVKDKDESLEEFWRKERYKYFYSLEKPVVTCHHLDDCVETWIWSSLHGEGKIIPYSNNNVIRPFRLTRKTDFTEWCLKNNVSWIEDESNNDTKYMRNFIRHELMPKALVVNPGLHKVIAKKVMKDEPERSKLSRVQERVLGLV